MFLRVEVKPYAGFHISFIILTFSQSENDAWCLYMYVKKHLGIPDAYAITCKLQPISVAFQSLFVRGVFPVDRSDRIQSPPRFPPDGYP